MCFPAAATAKWDERAASPPARRNGMRAGHITYRHRITGQLSNVRACKNARRARTVPKAAPFRHTVEIETIAVAEARTGLKMMAGVALEERLFQPFLPLRMVRHHLTQEATEVLAMICMN